MRFAMITTFYPPYSFGGDATYVRSLAQGLARRGHEVTVIACRDAYALRGPPVLAPAPEDDGVKVHWLRSRWRALSPLVTQQLGVPGFKAASLRTLLSEPFDVINFHNISLIGGPGILAYGDARVRLYTLHEHWLICPTHILWKNRSKACDKPQCLTCSIRSGIPPQLWRYGSAIRHGLAHVDRLIAPSEYTAERHRRGGIQDDISVLPLFSGLVPPTDFVRSDLARPLFLFVGRVTESKGVSTLLRVAAQLPQFDFAIVGDGDARVGLQACYTGSPNICFHGHLQQSALMEHYARAAALVFPSLAPETFGLSIVEAAAFGVPAIVASGSGGAAEIVSQSGGGLLFDSERILTSALIQLGTDAAYARKLGEKAHDDFLRCYQIETHLNNYLALIDGVR
jgi:glycosyltransferase involved in cell wall biosynthesis